MSTSPTAAVSPERSSAFEVFRVAFTLGLTSFGGPVAHLGYFERDYVARRGWLSQSAFANLVALCQLLPGPASSQLGMAIGLRRAGWAGGLAAWLGFTLPSAVILTGFALVAADTHLADSGFVHGLKLAAVAVVGAAVWSMWRTLAPDLPRSTLVLCAAAAALATSSAASQAGIILGGAIVGSLLLQTLPYASHTEATPSPVSGRVGCAALIMFAVLLVTLPLATVFVRADALAVFEGFFRAGALVFGGGHVVLPLLSETVVRPGWVSEDAFLTGYGAAQAIPGPLFTFAAYLGASLEQGLRGVAGAAIALVAIFLPGTLLMIGALPFWDALARMTRFRSALAGTNAAVTGVLLAALYDPVWSSSVASAVDVALALASFGALTVWRVSPLLVVAVLASAGEILARLG